MVKTKIALTVISKDKEDLITRLLDSTNALFDYYILVDTGSSDRTVEVWKEWCDKKGVNAIVKVGSYPTVDVSGKQTLADFSAARNDTLELLKNTDADFGFWCDSDDVLVNPEAIIESAEYAQRKGINFVFAKYNYAPIDPKTGKSPLEQIRERLYRVKQKGLAWINPVHENLKSDEMGQDKVIIINDFYVQHLRDIKDTMETGRRNKLIMERWIKEKGVKNCEYGMIRNYAFDAYEHKEFTTAKRYYKIALKKLEGPNRPVQFLMDIYDKLCRIYSYEHKYSSVIKYANKMIETDTRNATGYLHLAQGYLDNRQPELAITASDVVIQLGAPEQLDAINKNEYDIRPRQIAGEAYLFMNQLDSSIDVYTKLVNKYPLENSFKQRLNEIYRAKDEATVIKAISSIESYMADRGLFDKQQMLIQAIPEDLKQVGQVAAMLREMTGDVTRKLNPLKISGKKTVSILCGPSYEKWDARNIDKGIGGSEEMVINMARELAKLGNVVEVYNECKENIELDGVKYVHHSEFDNGKNVDVLIVWRNPDAFRQVFNAKKQYLWLHDTYYGNHKPRVFYLPNAVFALTNAHKNILKQAYGIKDSQFWITANGVDIKLVPDVDEKKRNPHKIIYGSSYDRGLLELLKMWKDVKAEVPDAELDVCYGWNTYDAMMNARLQSNDPQGKVMQEYKEQCIELLKQDGVNHLGRIGQKEQLELMGTCGIWAYPTWFSEISCITAMKAQIMGAIPVCTPVAALKETVKYGIKVGDEQLAMRKDEKVLSLYKQALISLLKDTKRQDAIRPTMMKESRKIFSIEELAKSWNAYFEK